jgi:hypothetical protein
MPLITRDIRDLDEKPLARHVLETRLEDSQLHRTWTYQTPDYSAEAALLTTRVYENFGQSSGSSCPDFSPNPLSEIENPWPNYETPTLIP